MWRHNALDVCVQVRSYRKQPLQRFLDQFRLQDGISIIEPTVRWQTEHHVPHSHFRIHPHDPGVELTDGKQSDDAIEQVNAFSMMSDDVRVMLEPGAPHSPPAAADGASASAAHSPSVKP